MVTLTTTPSLAAASEPVPSEAALSEEGLSEVGLSDAAAEGAVLSAVAEALSRQVIGFTAKGLSVPSAETTFAAISSVRASPSQLAADRTTRGFSPA